MPFFVLKTNDLQCDDVSRHGLLQIHCVSFISVSVFFSFSQKKSLSMKTRKFVILTKVLINIQYIRKRNVDHSQ